MIKLIDKFDLTKNPKVDILSGFTVSLALVPEAIAFAFVAGVEPLVGLYAAFFVGIITAVFGGRTGMISGATGAMAVVMVVAGALASAILYFYRPDPITGETTPSSLPHQSNLVVLLWLGYGLGSAAGLMALGHAAEIVASATAGSKYIVVGVVVR